jgi:GNAT superfamily N-acetyltransferase
VDEPDIRALAQLHMSCLTDSFVSALGARYVNAFYRYVTRSDKEIALVERNRAGDIVAATVISLEPQTLTRRLLWRTPLLISVVRHAPRILALLRPGDRSPSRSAPGDACVPASVPEMLLMFTAPGERGRGLATTLVGRADERLRDLKITEYQVRTVMDSSNRALAFYRDRQFVPRGTSFRLGKVFQVFTRALDSDATGT